MACVNALQANFAAQHFHGLKQRRRILASADGDADGLKHRPGLQSQTLGGRAQCSFERGVIEGAEASTSRASIENLSWPVAASPFWRNQLMAIIRRKLRQRKRSPLR